jgi:hypothetical protein
LIDLHQKSQRDGANNVKPRIHLFSLCWTPSSGFPALSDKTYVIYICQIIHLTFDLTLSWA